MSTDTKKDEAENQTKEALQRQNTRLRSYIYKYEQFRQGIQACVQAAKSDPQGPNPDKLIIALDKAMGSMRQAEPQKLNADIVHQIPELIGKHALVLYFPTDEDRDGFADVVMREMPDVQLRRTP